MPAWVMLVAAREGRGEGFDTVQVPLSVLVLLARRHPAKPFNPSPACPAGPLNGGQVPRLVEGVGEAAVPPRILLRRAPTERAAQEPGLNLLFLAFTVQGPPLVHKNDSCGLPRPRGPGCSPPRVQRCLRGPRTTPLHFGQPHSCLKPRSRQHGEFQPTRGGGESW